MIGIGIGIGITPVKGGGVPITDIVAWGDSLTIPVQAGLVPLAVTRVLATGTTATGIVAVW